MNGRCGWGWFLREGSSGMINLNRQSTAPTAAALCTGAKATEALILLLWRVQKPAVFVQFWGKSGRWQCSQSAQVRGLVEQVQLQPLQEQWCRCSMQNCILAAAGIGVFLAGVASVLPSELLLLVKVTQHQVHIIAAQAAGLLTYNLHCTSAKERLCCKQLSA